MNDKELFPADAHSFEVFAIKDSDDSPTGKQAFIGYKISNGDFHFAGVPYTENLNFLKDIMKERDELKQEVIRLENKIKRLNTIIHEM